MVHVSFGNLEVKKAKNMLPSEGSSLQTEGGLYCTETSNERVSTAEKGILNRVKQKFGKVLRRDLRDEPPLGNHLSPQRTQVNRHRKIVRTHFSWKPAERPTTNEPKPSVRFLGIRRAISLPSDEMEKVHLNLKRSASSKAVLKSIRQESGDETNRFHTLEERIVEQTKDFCRDIIIQTLKRNNLFNRVKISRPVTVDQWITYEVQTICIGLERRNPTLCRNISKQIGVTLRSEEVLRNVFFELGLEVISNDIPLVDKRRGSIAARRNSRQEGTNPNRKIREITWGRIMAVFVIAGGFSLDCIQQGHSELVAELIQICGEFFLSQGVIKWIIAQGGWETLREVNSIRTKEPDPTNTWNVVLISACVVASLAIGIGISNLSLSTGGL